MLSAYQICGRLNGLHLLSVFPRRCISLSFSRRDIFNVQDTDDFNERVLKSDKLVLVDFYAKWCGPCKQLTPRLESVAEKFADDVHLAKVDIDNNEELADRFQVSAVPVVIAMKNGTPQDKFVGLQDTNKLTVFVRKLLDK